MSFSKLKKELIKLDKEKLIALIEDLYTKNKYAKLFLDLYVNPDEASLFLQYKKLVWKQFSLKGGFDYSLSGAKKVLTEFKNLGVTNECLARLMLEYVWAAIDYTRQFGDIDTAFYYSIGSTFYKASELLSKEGVCDKYDEIIKQEIAITKNFGWGLEEDMKRIYNEFYKK